MQLWIYLPLTRDEAQLEGAVTPLRGDARLLRRLLRNLLENARRHGSPPTLVRIAPAGGVATITVRDSGPGLPASEFENVFRPFYRPANSRNPAGTGLGLAPANRTPPWRRRSVRNA